MEGKDGALDACDAEADQWHAYFAEELLGQSLAVFFLAYARVSQV